MTKESMSSALPFRREWHRKAIHLTAVFVPLAYYFLSQQFMIIVISFGLAIALVVEWQRRTNNRFGDWFRRVLGPMLRASEQARITGATYLIMGCLVSVLVFPKSIAIFAMSVGIIADALAALCGRGFGRHKLIGGKTIEGSSTFFLTTFVLAKLILNCSVFPTVLGALVLMTIELWSNDLDNLVLPVSAGIVIVGMGYVGIC